MTLPSVVEYPYQIRHKSRCFGVMFFLKRRISSQEPLRAVDAIYPDGLPVRAGSFVECRSCMRAVPEMASELIEERPKTVPRSVWKRFAHGDA